MLQSRKLAFCYPELLPVPGFLSHSSRRAISSPYLHGTASAANICIIILKCKNLSRVETLLMPNVFQLERQRTSATCARKTCFTPALRHRWRQRRMTTSICHWMSHFADSYNMDASTVSSSMLSRWWHDQWIYSASSATHLVSTVL